ncbi:MAG: FMN-binding protein [Candidatus Paceibacterota bacterium]
MKKIILSFVTIASFTFYALFLRGSQSLSYQSPTNTEEKNSYPTPVVTPPKTRGLYQDGTFVGNSADAYYGYIQVEAVIKNGELADVIFLDYPQDRPTSVRINNLAMPILKREAIKSQNANVATVSGATDSSIAFRESLAAALSKAKI